MSNPIPQFWEPNLRPEVVGGNPAAPDIWSTILSQFKPAYEQSFEQANINSRSSAEHEIAKQQNAIALGHLKLAQEQQRSRQAELDLENTRHKMAGDALGKFFESYGGGIPMGQAQQMLRQGLPWMQQGPNLMNPQLQVGGMPQPQAPQSPPMGLGGSPGPQMAQGGPDVFSAIASALQGVDPQARQEALSSLLPAAKMAMPDVLPVDSGDYTTLIDRGTGQVVSRIPKGVSPTEKSKEAVQLQVEKEKLAMTRELRVQQQSMNLKSQFERRTKPIWDRGLVLNQALLSLDQAANSPDPATRRVLTNTAVANFVQGADQKAQLRIQTLQYLENFDHSLKGRLDIAVSKLRTGQYPDYVYQGLIAHIRNLQDQVTKEYSAQRDAEIRRHPDLANWLAAPEEAFSPNFNVPQPQANPQPPPPLP